MWKLLVMCFSNKKPLMTTAIFEECLAELNHMMKQEKRKIPLLDNASRRVTKVMSNVTAKFLPPNITSEVLVHLLDRGIIRDVKACYLKKCFRIL
jgi:hypothetical protein